MIIEVEAELPYNLELTMKPSFLSSLYRREGDWWIKVAGFLAGNLKFRQVGGKLIAKCMVELDRNLLIEEVMLESGLWSKPFEDMISSLPRSVRSSVEFLATRFPGVRLAVSPRDFNCIFIGAVLSKRANYEVFVKNWVYRIWKLFKCDFKALASSNQSKLLLVGSSYQICNLKRTLESYLKLYDYLPLNLPPPILRRKLMVCWGVGPKVADATILFTRCEASVIPVDVHLARAAKYFGWAREFRVPVKQLCLKYACNINESNVLQAPICPLSLKHLCLRENLRRIFGGLGGWIQTLTYLAGRKLKLWPRFSL